MDSYNGNGMYQQHHDYPTNRSSSTSRGYNGPSATLNRQPSRHFLPNNYDNPSLPQQSLYQSDSHAQQRYEHEPRYDSRLQTPVLTSGSFYDSHTWSNNSYGVPNHSANTMGGTGGRIRVPGGQSQRRAGIPGPWMGMNGGMNENQMSPMQNTSGFPNGFPNPYINPPMPTMHGPPPSTGTSDDLEATIPTAIVIKNIPFAVKKEELIQLMSELCVPLPYAFNYHFDGGVFRGLAFANFTTSGETDRAIDALNHYDLQGRKLRVEYKRMLPADERARIERLKREKRGQLQEQHEGHSLQNQASMNSLSSNVGPSGSPAPYQGDRLHSLEQGIQSGEINLEDPVQVRFFAQLLAFRTDTTRDSMVFGSNLSPADRRKVHTLAHYLGLEHTSDGVGQDRQVQISRRYEEAAPAPPPMPQQSSMSFYNEPQSRLRQITRAATTDFSETRAQALDSTYPNHHLSRQNSRLDVPNDGGISLRGAKSFADLRTYSPSPSTSSNSFPANLTQNLSRYANTFKSDDPSQGSASGTPNLTPTSGNGREDLPVNLLTNGISNITFQNDRAQPSYRTNGPRAQENNAGPIGSQRPINGNLDDVLRSGERNARAEAERQPRGPTDYGMGNGFRSRQNGQNGTQRNSDELNGLGLVKGWEDNSRAQYQDSNDRNGGYHH